DLSRRRVREPVAERLRPRRLLLRVAGVPLPVVPRSVERTALALGRIRQTLGSAGGRHVDVDADAVTAILHADRRRDGCPPVTTLRDPALVAEPAHEYVPRLGDPLDAPSRPRRLSGEAVARQRWADDVEGVRGAATMRRRIHERPDHLVELDDGAGP